jgi:hypothetical protein
MEVIRVDKGAVDVEEHTRSAPLRHAGGSSLRFFAA